MTGLLRQFFGERPHRLVQSLPTDGWCQIPEVARMSLVWPWYSAPDPEPLVDVHSRSVGVIPAVELRAPRTDADVVLIVWAESGGGFVVGPEWAQSVARLYPGHRIEGNIALQLNGAVGRLVRISDGRMTHWRIIVPRHESCIHLETSAPSHHADAYWVQIESMLATWGWDD